MSNKDNIEQLFQDRFNSFEESVDPSVWNAVQNELPQPGSAPSDPGMAQTGGKLVFGQFNTAAIITLGSIAASLLIAFGAYQYLNEEETPVRSKQEIVEQEVILTNEQEDLDMVFEKEETELVLENNDKNVIKEQPEVVQNEPDITKEDKAENDEQQIVPSFEPANSELATEENNSAPKGIENVSSENTPIEEPANSTPNERDNNEQEPFNEELMPTAPEVLLANIEFEKVAGEPYTFKFTNSGQGSRYEWDMGDGSYAILDDPKHTFDRPGEYTIKLTVHAQDGRSKMDQILVKVFEPSELIIPPAAISPNGDRVNDIYNVEGQNIQQVSIKVFNMGQALVFTSNSFEKDWEGNDNTGRPLPPGQYAIVIIALGTDSVPHEIKTFVSLYR